MLILLSFAFPSKRSWTCVVWPANLNFRQEINCLTTWRRRDTPSHSRRVAPLGEKRKRKRGRTDDPRRAGLSLSQFWEYSGFGLMKRACQSEPAEHLKASWLHSAISFRFLYNLFHNDTVKSLLLNLFNMSCLFIRRRCNVLLLYAEQPGFCLRTMI